MNDPWIDVTGGIKAISQDFKNSYFSVNLLTAVSNKNGTEELENKVKINLKISFLMFFVFSNVRSSQSQFRISDQFRQCPNTELFLIRIFLYSVRIEENTDQK